MSKKSRMENIMMRLLRQIFETEILTAIIRIIKEEKFI